MAVAAMSASSATARVYEGLDAVLAALALGRLVVRLVPGRLGAVLVDRLLGRVPTLAVDQLLAVVRLLVHEIAHWLTSFLHAAFRRFDPRKRRLRSTHGAAARFLATREQEPAGVGHRQVQLPLQVLHAGGGARVAPARRRAQLRGDRAAGGSALRGGGG